MNYLFLSLILTSVFAANAHTKYQRRSPRTPYTSPFQNMLGPGNERRLANRRPIAEVVARNQIGMPNTVMARDGMPNMRAIQTKCPCQTEQLYQRIQEKPAMPAMPAMPPYIPNVPVVQPPAPVPVAPVAFPPVPEITVPYPVPNVIQEFCPCREPALVSPFLPAASPISAMAPPTSNLLPPVIPSQNRHHFLRKIPIPPPTL